MKRQHSPGSLARPHCVVSSFSAQRGLGSPKQPSDLRAQHLVSRAHELSQQLVASGNFPPWLPPWHGDVGVAMLRFSYISGPRLLRSDRRTIFAGRSIRSLMRKTWLTRTSFDISKHDTSMIPHDTITTRIFANLVLGRLF